MALETKRRAPGNGLAACSILYCFPVERGSRRYLIFCCDHLYLIWSDIRKFFMYSNSFMQRSVM